MPKNTPVLLIILFLGSILGCVQSEQDETTQGEQEMTTNTSVTEPLQWSKEELMGHFDPIEHPGFVKIDPPYASREGMYLRAEAEEAFRQMADEAGSQGVRLQIISATRSFARQKVIWNRKWNGQTLVQGQDLARTHSDPVARARAILRYSSMPGSSRHHWGTDIDINSLNNAYFESGQGLQEYDWLLANARDYGFCQTYTAKDSLRPHGYEEEKWHWSYLPLSLSMTQESKILLKDEDFVDFDGSQTAAVIGILNHYILGINPLCL